MKTLLKLFLALFVLFVILLGIGLFVLTRPGVQKKLVESQLPEGSSIRAVRITTSSLELSELKLALPDGTEVRLEMLDTDFKPLAAIFDKTIKLGALSVDGLVVEIPQTLIQSPSKPTPLPDLPSQSSKPTKDTAPVDRVEVASPGKASSPTDILYAIGQIDWLLDIDSIQLEGELRDGAGSSYAIDMKSGEIRPGKEATIDASLRLNAREALHAGLKNFDASTRVFLKQNVDGGFEKVRIESLTKASDANGNNLLTVNQDLTLTVQGFDEVASLDLTFNADLPKPEIFLPELATAGSPVNLQGAISAEAKGSELTLSETDLLLSLAGTELASVKLNKQFTVGGSEDLSGNLMDVRITNLPLSLLAPWMPAGLSISGDPISAQFNLTGLPGGALQLSSLAPLRVGPMSLSQDGRLLLDQVTILAQPLIQMAADQSISWTLNDFQIQDRYGAILSGQSTGRYDPSATTSGFLPAGLKTQTKLDIGLQEITQQPALAEYASILSGRSVLDIKVDPNEKYPLQVQGKLDAISPRAYPGQRQNYRFALQLNEPSTGVVAIGANLQAGSEDRPTSSMQFTGQVRPEAEPLKFKLDLSSPRLSQGDFELLRAAFESRAPDANADMPPRGITAPTPSTPRPSVGSPTPAIAEAGELPPWAGYDGELDVKVGELYLLSGMVLTDVAARAVVTESQLSLSQLEAKYQGGELSGKGEARFSKGQRMAYTIQTDLNFKNMDPAMFAKNRSDSFPVRGIFDGKAKLTGIGASLDAAVDGIEGEILVTGREGVLTAFKLDNRSNLGLIGAGLLGSQLNRPGLTAMAQAVPYFENMPFTDFTLRLNRSSDRRIVIPELRFVGRNLLIDGTGSIAASSLKEAMNQPLDLLLELGAKGKLVDYLETLSLLGPNTAEDGFRRWNKEIKITGSLGDPNTSALQRILKDAANRALTESSKDKEKAAAKAETTAEETPAEGAPAVEDQNLKPKPSKEEKILQDVGTGLEILDSLF